MISTSLFPWERWFEFLAPKLDGQTLAISGSTGFVGRSLLSFISELALASGIRLKLITGSHTNPLPLDTNWNIHHDHVTGGSVALLNMVEKNEVTHFIHLSTPTTKESGSHQGNRVAAATLEALEGLSGLKNLSNDFRLVHASSGAVYGPRMGIQNPSQLSDDWDLSAFDDPVRDNYTTVKRRAEEAVLKGTLNGKWLGTNARLFAFMGPGLPLDSHFAIGNFVRDSIAKRDIVIRGNPRTVRAYLPSEVLAANLLEVTFAEFYPVCHISSDDAHSLETYARILASQSGTNVFTNEIHAPASYYVGVQDSRLRTSMTPDITEYLKYWTSMATRN